MIMAGHLPLGIILLVLHLMSSALCGDNLGKSFQLNFYPFFFVANLNFGSLPNWSRYPFRFIIRIRKQRYYRVCKWPIVMFTKCSFFLVCICVRNRRLKSTQSKMNLIWFLEWWWRVTIFFLIDLRFPLLVNLCRRVPLKSTVSLRFNPINHKTRCQQLSVSEKCIISLNENEIDSRNVCVCVCQSEGKNHWFRFQING